jgi:hypothetical protein
MEPTEGSETSVALKLTPGIYPKEDIQHSKPDESLKSRILYLVGSYHENTARYDVKVKVYVR